MERKAAKELLHIQGLWKSSLGPLFEVAEAAIDDGSD